MTNTKQTVLTDEEILQLAVRYGIGTMPVLSGSELSKMPSDDRLLAFAQAVLALKSAPAADPETMDEILRRERERPYAPVLPADPTLPAPLDLAKGAGDVALPPLPDLPRLPVNRAGDGPRIWSDEEAIAYAHSAVLADRQQRGVDENDRDAWAADMIAAGARHLGGDCWEWDVDDFEFRLWQRGVRRQQHGHEIQEFINATDALLESQARKTWTSGYVKEMTACERVAVAARWRNARATLATTKGESNG